MAESVLLSALLPLVLEKIRSVIQQQVVKSWKDGKDLKRELWKMQHVVSTIQFVLQDAEVKQTRDGPLRLWLSDLKDAAYDAEDLLDDIDIHLIRKQRLREDQIPIAVMGLQVLDFFSPSHSSLMFHVKMSQRAKEINQRIDELANLRSKFNLRTNDNCSPQAMNYTRPPTHSYMPESEVIGREADVKRIIELLITQETRKDVLVLPIVGMGGLGKTTLAQMVYNHQKVKDHFELRMWVSVPDDFSVEKIIKTMIENATSSKCQLSDLDSLQRKLSEVIYGKRYLLTLDDVWNVDRQKWAALRVLLMSGACGSTVMVTTRIGNVSSIVGTVDNHMLAGLYDDECWTLFKRKAFVDGAGEYPSLVEIGRLIVNKCGGVPLAVIVLGGLMSGFKGDETKWKMVMESDLWDLPAGRNEILPALRLSYHHLPPHLRQCFAFCAIFSRGETIFKEDLIDLWMANEFIPSDDKGIESEFGGEAVFNDLAQRCFFEIISIDSKMETSCRMHDLIHDLAKSVMGHECCILSTWEDDSTRKFRHVIIDPKYVLPGSTRTPPFGTKETMRTLLIHNTKWQSLNCQNINNLRALRLCYCEMVEFPISICNLSHLRYLDLTGNKFETLPETMSMLFKLHTLNLRSCKNLRRLPKSMRRMSSLMHLYLDDCDSLECMPLGMGELKRLRYVVGSEVGSGRITDLKHWNLHGKLYLTGLQNVRSASDAEQADLGSKENLRVLMLRGDGSTGRIISEDVLQALRPHQNLRELHIRGYSGKTLPTWLMEDSMFLKNLKSISLRQLSECEHLPLVGHLPSLEFLDIMRMNSVKHVGGSELYGTTSLVVFPTLRSMRLMHMRGLEEWSGVEGRPSFPKLTDVTIIGCPELKTMPVFALVERIAITDCPRLNPARDSFACMRSLKKLWMGGECEKQIMMLEQEEELTLDSLSYLGICDLPWQLTSSSQMWKRFPSLQVLDIRLCSGLEGFHPQGLLRLTALQQLWLIDNPQLVALPELPESVQLVRIIGCGRLVSLPEGMGRLPALKYLELTDLPMLKTSLLDGYESLEGLWIKGCPGVESSLPLLTLRRPSLDIVRDSLSSQMSPDLLWDLILVSRRLRRLQHTV